MRHISVLTDEVIEALNLREDSVVLDATFGAGGHAKKICARLGKTGTYVGIDADSTALTNSIIDATQVNPTVHLINDNFRNIHHVLEQLQVPKVDAIIADLGWRTDQFESGEKGFSFNDDHTLLMTYGNPSDYTFTAYDIVNDWDEEHIADVIYGYGEERASRRIAKAIVNARKQAPIETGKALGEIVANALGGRRGKTHPATKTFQALRIAVNDELGALHTLVVDGIAHLAPQGRMAIISFHSLEDRLVKQLFTTYTRDHVIQKITKKPIIPKREEILKNPRARSAKLRIIEKL